MGSLVGWAWRTLYRLVCDRCGELIWAWQPRHENRHAACDHAERDRLYQRARWDYEYDVPSWTCPHCGGTVG